MTRRGFFEVTAGALILGPMMGPTVLRYHVPTRTIRKVREFPKETILEIDEEGRVHPLVMGDPEWIRLIKDPRWRTIRKDVWSPRMNGWKAE